MAYLRDRQKAGVGEVEQRGKVVQDEIGGLGRTRGHPDLVDFIRKIDPNHLA